MGMLQTLLPSACRNKLYRFMADFGRTGEGVPNENFTQAWLRLNGETASFAHRIKNERSW